MNCDVCSRAVAEGEAIQVWGKTVCVDCKPAFVQSRREGVPLAEVELSGELRERLVGFGELFVLTWRVLIRGWPAILGLALLVSVPINLLLYKMTSPDGESWRQMGQHFRLAQMLQGLIGVVAELGIIFVVSERLQGRSLQFGPALGMALRRWGAAVGTNILGGLIVLLLLLCLIIPGIIWSVYYTFAICVVALRGQSGQEALNYSKSLVQGRWWSVAFRLMSLTVAALVPVALMEIAVAFAPPSFALSFASSVVTDVLVFGSSVGSVILFLNVDAMVHRSVRAPGAMPFGS